METEAITTVTIIVNKTRKKPSFTALFFLLLFVKNRYTFFAKRRMFTPTTEITYLSTASIFLPSIFTDFADFFDFGFFISPLSSMSSSK